MAFLSIIAIALFLPFAVASESEVEIDKLIQDLRASETRIKQHEQKLSVLQGIRYSQLHTNTTDEIDEESLNNFIEKMTMTLNSTVIEISQIALKPIGIYRDVSSAGNAGILVTYDTGIVELFDLKGVLLYRYKTGHIPKLVCTTTNYEDVRFITIDGGNQAKVHKVTFDRIKNMTEPLPDVQEFGL
jgi:hypothetical protein